MLLLKDIDAFLSNTFFFLQLKVFYLVRGKSKWICGLHINVDPCEYSL